MRVYIHVGLPKTATTSLQRFVFPEIGDKGLYLGKRYSEAGEVEGLWLTDGPERFPTQDQFIQSIETEGGRLLSAWIYFLGANARELIARGEPAQEETHLLTELMRLVFSVAQSSDRDAVLFSNETYATTKAALTADEDTAETEIFLAYFMKVLEQVYSGPVIINVTYRDPKDHLMSLYKQSIVIRTGNKLPVLGLEQWLESQVKLVNRDPALSAFTMAMHTTHRRLLETFGEVRVSEFTQLTEAEDALECLGIAGLGSGSLKARYSNVARENVALPISDQEMRAYLDAFCDNIGLTDHLVSNQLSV